MVGVIDRLVDSGWKEALLVGWRGVCGAMRAQKYLGQCVAANVQFYDHVVFQNMSIAGMVSMLSFLLCCWVTSLQ